MWTVYSGIKHVPFNPDLILKDPTRCTPPLFSEIMRCLTHVVSISFTPQTLTGSSTPSRYFSPTDNLRTHTPSSVLLSTYWVVYNFGHGHRHSSPPPTPHKNHTIPQVPQCIMGILYREHCFCAEVHCESSEENEWKKGPDVTAW